MVAPLKNADSLDTWIKTEAFKYAYNEKTRGFIGKKYVKERVLSAVPRELIALGHTREQVVLRLNDMLADDLTQALIRDCDEKRTRANKLEANALRNLLSVVPGEGPGATSDHGVPTASVNAAHAFGTAAGGVSSASDVGTYVPRATSIGVLNVSNNGAGTSSAGAAATAASTGDSSRFSSLFGVAVQKKADEKGKKLMSVMIEDEVDEDANKGTAFSTTYAPNQKFVPASPAVSVSDVDRVVADFVAAKSPGLSEIRPKITSKLDTVDDPKDIFSRGGSTPQRSRSSASSIFISPPPPPSSDPDIPSLPFKLQHRILITLQGILECACYDFARKNYPSFLIRKGWDCPEAGELTHWTRGLAAEFRENPTRVVREAEHFPLALKGIDEIRHSAVHRVPVSGRDIQRLIERTRVFLHMIDAAKRMRDQIDEINEIIERNIHIVSDKRRKKEEKLRQELEKLEEWKRILELREVRAIRQAEYEEENIQKTFRDEVGQALEALGAEESVAYSVGTGAEPDNSSVGNTKEEEPTLSEAKVKPNVEESTLGQEDEYFHEPAGWPVGEGEEYSEDM